MKSFQKGLAAAALLVCGCASALAQTSNTPGNATINNPNGPGPMPNNGPVRMMNEASTSTGTIIRRDLKWNSSIPLDKTYAEFSPEEKAAFEGLYESLPAGDEPPFPAAGLRPVFNNIRKGQQIVKARGKLNLVVTVDANGKATQVADLGGTGGPNALEMTRYAGSILLMTKFKPAICGGKPCQSQFPFMLDLRMH